MLPSIGSVAEKYQVDVNPNTYGRKELMCRCPFCNSKKHHLSLNTEKNVFKCWRCKKSGGVIQFESLLSNEPFQEIREKYFGKKKKTLHPAYNLSPDQLREIGWYDKRREN